MRLFGKKSLGSLQLAALSWNIFSIPRLLHAIVPTTCLQFLRVQFKVSIEQELPRRGNSRQISSASCVAHFYTPSIPVSQYPNFANNVVPHDIFKCSESFFSSRNMFRIAFRLLSESSIATNATKNNKNDSRTASICVLYQFQAVIVWKRIEENELYVPSTSSWKWGPANVIQRVCCHSCRLQTTLTAVTLSWLLAKREKVDRDIWNA